MDLTVGLWPFVLALVAGFVAHELLHAVGFLAFGRIPRRAIKFGVHWSWQVIMPYCTCSVPVPAYIYRIAVLLPGIVLGVLPALLGIILKEANMTFWGALMFAGAGGDFTILWLIRSVPASALVRDHPSEIGCEILDE
ncbi:MAG: DUF3267 domain-containing protein [bacterium JZ-2024 1]